MPWSHLTQTHACPCRSIDPVKRVIHLCLPPLCFQWKPHPSVHQDQLTQPPLPTTTTAYWNLLSTPGWSELVKLGDEPFKSHSIKARKWNDHMLDSWVHIKRAHTKPANPIEMTSTKCALTGRANTFFPCFRDHFIQFFIACRLMEHEPVVVRQQKQSRKGKWHLLEAIHIHSALMRLVPDDGVKTSNKLLICMNQTTLIRLFNARSSILKKNLINQRSVWLD